MSSYRERRQADMFFADLMGLSRPFAPWRRSAQVAERIPIGYEEDAPERNLKSGRVVFYDEDTLRFVEGWTRATSSDDVFLINRGVFNPIRENGRTRSRMFEDYVRRRIHGAVDLQSPAYYIDSTLHTAPLVPTAPGDWDDLMISRLIAAARPLTVQSEKEQWVFIRRLFDDAVRDARRAAPTKSTANERVAFFVLDNVTSTLTLVTAQNVRMHNNHAVIPLGRIRGTSHVVLPNGHAGERVIGDIHTHVLLDPLIDLSSTTVGAKIPATTRSLHSGVSDVDVASARDDRIVVYAVDSKYLHRANPSGSKNDKLPRSGNVLREALRIFGGEPR